MHPRPMREHVLQTIELVHVYLGGFAYLILQIGVYKFSVYQAYTSRPGRHCDFCTFFILTCTCKQRLTSSTCNIKSLHHLIKCTCILVRKNRSYNFHDIFKAVFTNVLTKVLFHNKNFHLMVHVLKLIVCNLLDI